MKTERYHIQGLQPAYGNALEVPLPLAANTEFERGQVVALVTAAAANCKQTITFPGSGDVPTAGTFVLSIERADKNGTEATLALDYDISNANVKKAIENLLDRAGYFGATVTIASGPAPATFAFTVGGQWAGKVIPLMTVASDLKKSGGDAVTATIAMTTSGVEKDVIVKYNSSGNDGSQTAIGVITDCIKTNYYGSAMNDGIQTALPLISIGGIYRKADIVGLDATSSAALGKVIGGWQIIK